MTVKDDRYLDPAVETMSREDLERLQESRILQLVPYVYQRSPLVRELWEKHGVTPDDIKSLADFKAKVPFMDKDMIRDFRDRNDDPFGGLACVGPPHMRGVGFTSGTTGDPTPLPRPEDNAVLIALKRELWHIGMRPGDTLTYLLFTFREGMIADRWMDTGFTPICVQHSPLDIPYLIQISKEYRPKALFMISTPMILGLEQYEKNTGEDIKAAFSSYEGIVFGGEPMSPHIRKLMERWDFNVYELTSLGDVATATECSAHDGMHTWEDVALIEHLDPDGDSDAEDGGRGEMVVTALLDDVAPLIRFRTDDLIEFTRKPCTCGRTHGRMKPLGRKGDELVVNGRSVLPIDIFPFIGDFPETRTGLFQIIRPQRETDILKLRVGYDIDALQDGENALIERIKARIKSELDLPSDIELMTNDEMVKLGPPNKIPRVSKS
ncbi:phenylacetate--CoA ligase family protein [Spongiibacter nanhainus]|uniref:Phenylacetate--CoA ligase family protein n=1 Tax=Spongiibacter nanhainus TaxID=2794344 RepID=A0A7T4QZ09_9GAMM|nr:phenylacetate--CoA ligase family protein [Spongiibacter nanhainus]QQD17322.1 phenylacetate--CoA ligase family protein [Spongiibacter nanhainus]